MLSYSPTSQQWCCPKLRYATSPSLGQGHSLTLLMLQKMRIRRIQKKTAITPVPIRMTISTLVLSSEPVGQEGNRSFRDSHSVPQLSHLLWPASGYGETGEVCLPELNMLWTTDPPVRAPCHQQGLGAFTASCCLVSQGRGMGPWPHSYSTSSSPGVSWLLVPSTETLAEEFTQPLALQTLHR